MRDLVKIALPIGFGLWILLATVLRAYLVYRRTGINPILSPKGDSAHAYIERLLRVLIVAATVDVGLVTLSRRAYLRLGPLPWMEHDLAAAAGLLLLALSTLIMLVAQAQMGASWRIGIDTERRTELVARGLYRRSRNPIYVGILGALAALVLLAPNALSLVCAAVGFVAVQIQTRLEEEHLARLHGEAYEEYRRRVPRWL